jgi:hypothetical protein
VLAHVTVGTQALDLTPDQVGVFPRVYLEPAQKVAVVAEWPEARTGARVVASIEDGGSLSGGQRVLPLDLDGRSSAAFDFRAGMTPGIYRVTLRQGADAKTLEFWVGPEPALQANSGK